VGGIWNSTLRDLDVWHLGLIAEKDLLKIQRSYDGWAGKWYGQYRYYREVGEEIDRRLANNEGEGEGVTVDRLNAVRQSILYSPTIHGLADGLRAA
jgi:hypothetical protein